MKKQIINVVFLLLIFSSGYTQILVNQGQMNISSGFLVINDSLVNQGSGNLIINGTIQLNGSFMNQGSGNINLDGTFLLSGDWTNNAANTGMSAPNGTGTVIFNGSSLQTIGACCTDSLDFEGITINSGASVQVQAGLGITTQGPCVFNTPLLLKTSTPIYQPKMATFINNNTVTGNISMELSYTSNGTGEPGGHGQFFSSPISNATNSIFGSVNDSTNRLYTWDVVNKYKYDTIPGSSLALLTGYLYRGSTTSAFTFTGPPNTNASYTTNGPSRPANTEGYFLTGNPYPAVIDWTNLTKTNLDNTYYVRGISVLDGTMIVDTWNENSLVGTGNNGTPIDGKIAPMQGIWVKVSDGFTSGTFGVALSDRGHDWGNAPYLKSGSVNDNEIFRLYLYKGNFRDETIIVQADSAKDELDSYDSKKLPNGDASKSEIYTRSPDRSKLVIQSVKPVSQEKLFPICMNINTSGTFQFKADFTQTHSQYKYYLEDKQLSVMQDLQSNSSYTFTSSTVKDTAGIRFVVHVSPLVKSMDAPLTINSIANGVNELQIYSFGKDVHIMNCEPNAKIIIYNLLGSQVYSSLTNSDQETISISAPPGIYLVKLANGNSWKIQKVLLK